MFISRFIQANYFKKYLAENAVNTISEPLDFKIFWGGGGGDAPRPPYKLAPPALVFSPPLRNTLRRPRIDHENESAQTHRPSVFRHQ